MIFTKFSVTVIMLFIDLFNYKIVGDFKMKKETNTKVNTIATKEAEVKVAEETAKAEKVTKKATTKKTETKATTAKKTATKKTAEEAATSHVFIQINNCEIVADDVINKALEAYKAEGNKAKAKNINVYVKPEENAAYYVVNDTVAGRVNIF